MDRKEVCKNAVYRHFKGNFYYIVDIATDSETLERVVCYRGVYGSNTLYTRSEKMFLEEVDVGRADNVTKSKFRFERVDLASACIDSNAFENNN